MTRPRRLFTTEDGKFYYLIDGKKRFVKVPTGVSEKQIARINIKNIVNAPTRKRIKRRRKRVEPVYGAKVGNILQKSATGGLPIYFFKPQKEIPTLEQQAKESGDTDVKKLSKLLIKDTEFQTKLLKGMQESYGTSSKIPPTITPEASAGPFISFVRGRLGKSTEEKARLAEEKARLAEEKKQAKERKAEEKKRIAEEKKEEIERKKRAKAFGKELGSISIMPSNIEEPTLGPTFRRQDSEGSLGSARSAGSLASRFSSIFGRKTLPSSPVAEINEEEEKIAGTGDDGDGLYNDEIEKVVKKRIKNYVPVIASDQIDELPRYVARGDKRFGFVINTNPSTSDGSGNDGHRTGHWRSVYINNEDSYPTVEYFDPLTEGKMPSELVSICRKIALKMNPEMMFKYKQNMLRRQSKLSSNCGWHAVKFLDDRYNGIPWSESTGYDSYMAQNSSPKDDSLDGEQDIAKYIKKYESFI